MINSTDNSNNDGFASVPAIRQYMQQAEASNVDCKAMLAHANIDPQVLLDNNSHISFNEMEKLLASLITASNDSCFGLHSARFVEPASYSVLGYISMNCSTLRETLANTSIFEKIVGDMGRSSTNIKNGIVTQSWDCNFTDPIIRRNVIENVLGSWIVYLRNFAHLDTTLADNIAFEHDAPKNPELLKDYTDLFGCDVLFNQNVSGIQFKENLLDIALPQADKKLLKALLEHATQLLSDIDRDQPISVRVKNLLRLMLKTGEPSSSQIAEKLYMSSRTLQRKLSAEGTHYTTLLSDVRLELALHYIENTSLSLDQIAYELSYTEARSFYRSFKQWTGRTAGSYRTETTD
ncbi:MAG: AraC-like DNA-binding protein [Porticoccus sp.]|jgi:AraC-like DNA-binding protein